MSSNYLTLNPSNTEFRLTGLPQQTSQIIYPSLSLLSTQSILPTPSAKIKSRLQLWLHFLILVNRTPFKLLSRSYSRPPSYLTAVDFTTASAIATYLVPSCLDYCNSLYHSTPITPLKNSKCTSSCRHPQFLSTHISLLHSNCFIGSRSNNAYSAKSFLLLTISSINLNQHISA